MSEVGLPATDRQGRVQNAMGPAVRVSRRLSDRLYSVLKPVQRYRCRRDECAWVGNMSGGKLEEHANLSEWTFGLGTAVFGFFVVGLAILIFVI